MYGIIIITIVNVKNFIKNEKKNYPQITQINTDYFKNENL
jgi:hypothetical protein